MKLKTENQQALKNPIKRRIKNLFNALSNLSPVKLRICTSRSKWPDDRFFYQKNHIDFNLDSKDKVVDIGSGAYPFPYATVLVDLFPAQTRHRYEQLCTGNKAFVEADIMRLPFSDKYFDYVYCSHVLEHVDDPIKACKEIVRIGKGGYIETPTFGKDTLFAWENNPHKWYVVSCGKKLCFFEYSPRHLEGIRSSAWKDIIFEKWNHPLQKAFYENQDIFNIMFSWVDAFAVFVFRLNGTVETLENAER